MSLLIAATIEVGKAIAKAAFKRWVASSALCDDISSGLIDLIASKTSDTLAQRKGSRQFEDIADKVSEEVAELLRYERAAIEEGECIAITYAIAETINEAKISQDLLLKHNLQPAELALYLLDSYPQATRDISQDGAYLYRSMMKEACTYIIDIAAQLPSFNEHTFAEILKRNDLISDQVDQVLQEIRRMRAMLDPMSKADQFERAYRDAIIRRLGVVQLIGADILLPHRRYQLDMAYIGLSLSHSPLHQQAHNDIARFAERADHLMEISAQKTTVSVDEALAESKRLLILGPAGSGKTTLLQWIAVRAATKTFTGPLQSWNGDLPFYIRLREYAQRSLPTTEAFPETAAPLIIGTMPDQWVHYHLRSGRAIILIDGFDEVSAARREEVYTWLKDLVETYPECSFIITSREHAIERGWMHQETFQRALLQEMSLADIYAFIDHWHEAVKQELQTEEEKEDLTPHLEHLKAQVRHNRSIRNLATTPLLCAMLCALNRERKRQLPNNRIELYQACCSLLLERREKDRHIDLSDYPWLNQGQKQRLLADLAYSMIKEQLSEVSTESIDARFTYKLANMANISEETTGIAVRRFFVQRTGIIREPVPAQIDFAHRTFQEFFAAQECITLNDIRTLIKNAHHTQWREVIILAAGLASRAQCEKLINGLIRRGDRESKRRYQIHLLAASCLETAIELGIEIRDELDKRLSQLIPPKNRAEARALAATGELAIKHLDRKELTKAGKHLVTTYAACIHALKLIGGDAAFDLLTEYALDTRRMVVDELVEGWDSFDREAYAKSILAPALKTRGSLRLSRCSSLIGIHHLSHLISLVLSDCPLLTDLNPLTNLSQLTDLVLSDCPLLTDLNPLTNLSQLTDLSLSDCPLLTDLNPLTNLSQLTSLVLSDCPLLTDLSILTNLSQLTSLSLSDCPLLANMSILAHLPRLTSLNLINCPLLTDLSALALLPHLTSLGLTNTDLSILTVLSQLTSLDLTSLTDLSPLTGLSQLTSLKLRNCLQLSDLTLLADLYKLTSIYIFGCSQLSDLTPLTGLSQLTSLSLSGSSQLSDLTPLTGLSQLTSLNLHKCPQLSDLTPLIDLPRLEDLQIDDE